MSQIRRTKKDVFIMRPIDHSVLPLKVQKEEALACVTEPVNDLEVIVWKHGPGWNKPDGGRMFLSVEGELLTNYITEEGELVAAPLEEFLRFLWDEKYERLHPDFREPLEKDNYACTVTVKPVDMDPDTKNMFDRVKAAEILKDANLRQLETFGVSEPEINKTDLWINRILFLLTGAFGMYFLTNRGII